MTQDERWSIRYEEAKRFIVTNQRNPSKYNLEEHDMLNWLKATRKRMNAGELKPERVEQFKKLLSVSRSDVKLAIAICYYTGLRRGELLGLTWKDVGNDISVTKQLDTQHNITTDPKTKNSFRSIPIPQALRKMLKQYHDTQPLDISRRIFPRPYGTYYGMKQAMKLISKDLSPHCLRHTYATNLLAKGMDIRTVAALLGDNAKTVINTYIHYNDDMRSAAAKEIEKIFAENF
jgi:integrase